MKLKHFDNYVNKTDSCWLWTGTINRDGYGVYRGKLAHRISYIQHVGLFPPGTVTDHLCRVRNCVNPLHLEAVSRGENVRRGLGRATTISRHANRTHCKRGHELTPDNLYLNTYSDGFVRRTCKTCAKKRRYDSYHSKD